MGKVENVRRYYRGRIAGMQKRHADALHALYETQHKDRQDYRLLLRRLEETHAILTPEQRKMIVSQPPPPFTQGDGVRTYERKSTVKDNGMKIAAEATYDYETGKRKLRGKLRKKLLPPGAQKAIRERVKMSDLRRERTAEIIADINASLRMARP
jgi:hypothetical protein